MKLLVHNLGAELVENSRESANFSAQRGLINELFPYIYEASKRMSGRAISRWLNDKGVKLSPATIAKALRNPKPYWQELADRIEIAANIFADAHDLFVKDVVMEEKYLNEFSNRVPAPDAVAGEGISNSLYNIRSATEALQNEWFAIPAASREACLANADFHFEDEQLAGRKENREINE